MNLKKVIKVYFYLLIIIFSFVFFEQNFDMQKSFVSVMNALDYVSSDIVLIENIKVSDVDTIENFDFNYDYDSQSVFFEFSSKDITTSVHKIEGETEHIFSNIHVKNLSDYLVLKTMKLKINGNYSGIIKKIDLIYDDIIISSAYNIDGQFVFENIDFLLPNLLFFY